MSHKKELLRSLWVGLACGAEGGGSEFRVTTPNPPPRTPLLEQILGRLRV